MVFKTDRQIAAPEQRGEIFVTPTEVESKGQRSMLLKVRQEEVEKKTLAAPGCSQNDRMGDVLVMQIEKVWRPMIGLQDRQIFRAQVLVFRFAGVQAEQEREIGAVR